MTNSDVFKLWELQKIDLHRLKLQQRLAAPRHQAAHDDALALAKQELKQLKSAEDRQAALTKQIRQGELELATFESQIKELEATLYGGSVTNSRELAGLERKLASVRAAKSKQEDDLLAAMQELESVQQKANVCRQRAKILTRRYKELQADLNAEIAQLQSALDNYNWQREQLAATITPEWLNRYEKLSRQRPDVITMVDGNLCGTCRLPLPSALISTAAAGEKPAYCEGCGRMLYVP